MLERYYQIAGVRFRVLVPEQWLWSEEGMLGSGMCVVRGGSAGSALRRAVLL